jgi:hypothetical protein
MLRSSFHRSALDSIDEVLEAVCRRGCRYVLDLIARAERGQVPADMASLSPPDRRLVLSELKSVMAVYGGACRIDTPEIRASRIGSAERGKPSVRRRRRRGECGAEPLVAHSGAGNT